MDNMKLSITIIAFNEEHNIKRSVTSAMFADEVIVVDSGSTDRTTEIAKSCGAHVHQHPFTGYGQQKNYAASLCQGEWILNIDADEEISSGLKTEILSIIDDPQSHNLYQVPRLTQYVGQWIRHGGWYPGTISRLCKKNKAHWTEPHVHEDLQLTDSNGSRGFLKNNLLHYSFPTINSHTKTNLRFSSLAAKDLLAKKGRRPYGFEVILKPIGKFFECYLIKLGFLDGMRGFIIALNSAHAMLSKYSIAYLEDHDQSHP